MCGAAAVPHGPDAAAADDAAVTPVAVPAAASTMAAMTRSLLRTSTSTRILTWLQEQHCLRHAAAATNSGRNPAPARDCFAAARYPADVTGRANTADFTRSPPSPDPRIDSHPSGALCGLVYMVARHTRRSVWAAMVAAVRVSSPQNV